MFIKCVVKTIKTKRKKTGKYRDEKRKDKKTFKYRRLLMFA